MQFKMNWYRNSTIITEQPAAVKPESTGKKLRRKLQKIGTQQRWHKSNDNNNNDDVKKAGKININTNTKATTISKPIPHPNPRSFSETPDPNDGKWLEQLRKSGYLCRTQPLVEPSNKPHRHSMQVIPELAHLSLSETKPGRQLDKRASCAIPPSTASLSRRYAKTPVHHIGQLENHSRRKNELAAHRVSSVEQIAESYRALLESSCAILNEPPSPLRLEQSYHTGVNKYGVREDIIHEIPDTSSATGSPHSDDGTLVAFDEDAVSFKPASISPEPPSPRDIHLHRLSIPPPRRASPGSHSLQICLDLLGRELCSAANGSSLRPAAETSALQVWVMIEAYERLRDKVYDMRLDHDQERSLSTMLDTWIGALYCVHEKMTGNDGHESESDYGD
ncbi:uncharacterized protein GGS22DRAFT_185639 [Annulohypoxylon maeteangense]|uniref:uncharacterized protein n=1 Tax=Annulohypoxylon maeteangense TaxID=1927788 RepID=UPI0020075452|nr:uncharacterized protein GGS22DRAFT_185639 [Annulohypoxylon maeteangense]KAI0888260.1 hypothetical protein GGS22DRAFT_185639 [Annulohypoxylon maeteangense]